METKITDGRINIKDNLVVRSKPKFADYTLYLNDVGGVWLCMLILCMIMTVLSGTIFIVKKG